MDLRPFMERWHMLPPSGGVMLVAAPGKSAILSAK